MAKKTKKPEVKRTFYDALADLNKLISHVASGKKLDDKIEKHEDFAALKADPEETWYEVLGNAISNIEHMYEEDKDVWNDERVELKEQLEQKDKDIEEITEKVLPYVSVSMLEDGDYSGQSLGIYADNLKDQYLLDTIMKQFYLKGKVSEDVESFKIMR